MTMEYVDIVFDGPPGPESGRFVEVENAAAESIAMIKAAFTGFRPPAHTSAAISTGIPLSGAGIAPAMDRILRLTELP